jgi:hypothetical protein
MVNKLNEVLRNSCKGRAGDGQVGAMIISGIVFISIND